LRVECPVFQGRFVDDPDLSRALADVQEAIRMHIHLCQESGKDLPAEIDPDGTVSTLILVAA
jgi:hypothetical protein